ncbi:probable LRR receptor-like serine/threonine-protein kinase At2g24230 isoform X2 [Macadamia integrifolia]|uniref:probable LRR receptor-like serine/threonine-protein kinase At2g24230 isoform X2 n=1 Tax=Macadamia integrifolia TaxID=60698 RepID=UPI001C4EB8F2|nr:probable LRR receptor-like serine/threonine-protein kinase At2g24230 isoform X2 [Macadamia integrifolia]
MGFGFFGSILLLALFFRQSFSQQPNTDGFYVYDFLQKMGVISLEANNLSDSNSVCSWKWVFCDAHQENVIGLVASGLGLSGVIPDTTIGKLSKLESLDLSSNKITGFPSDFWGSGSSLTSLNLSNNQIYGSLPSNIGNFGVLQILDLSLNNFSGEVPASISSLSSLQVLKLDRNEFTGSIPLGVLSCQSLVSIDISFNLLNGSLPDGFGAAFPKLRTLNLAVNEIHGRSSDFVGLQSITYLNISGNLFQGSVMGVFQKQLQVIDLSRNLFEGHISQFSNETLESAFIGSLNSCPITANPDLFRRKTTTHNGLKLALAISLALVCLLVGLLCLAFGCRRKSRMWVVKQRSYKEEQNISGPFSFQTDSTIWVADVKVATTVPVVIFEKPLLNFTFADLLSATSNFDRGTLLAEGRFGPVYRGFLPGGIHVAVKVLVHGSTMTDQEAAREFEYLGRIKHSNLVPLTGYCLAGDQRIAIYDYMENGNLQNLLHDLPLGVQTTDDWSTDTWEEDNIDGIQNVGFEGLQTTWRFRHKIALGTARALAFLHHGCSPPIIHRDFKASSVYLDSNWDPRLSDFGLAKIFGNGLEDEMARGSQGYAPPEFSQPEAGSPTPKSDVYGFGVVLFELITGKKPVGDDYPDRQDSNLVSWVRRLVRENQGSSAIDPKIRGGMGPQSQMEEALRIAYLCTADLPSKRPSMHQIVGLLKDIEHVEHQ